MIKENKKWIFLFLLAVIWGSSFILIKKSLIGLSPLQLGSLRIIITGFILFIAGFNRLKSLKSLSNKSIKWIALSGFLGTFFPAFLFAYAETEIDSAIASILNSIVPINTLLFGFLAFNIISTKRQVIGVLIGFIGAIILISNGAAIHPNQNYWYALLVIAATVMYAFNINIIKRHLQNIPPLTIAIGNFIVLIIPAFLVLIFSDFFSSQVLKGPNFSISIFYVFLLSLFGTAIAKVLFNNLVQISTPVFASSVTYMMPIVALFWGILDNEVFSFWQGIATLIILGGVYLANSKR
jgi:drug/metabolite transporter (DMT)-like permease